VLLSEYSFSDAAIHIFRGNTNEHAVADEFKNDPRNPNAKTLKPADKH